MLKNLIQVAGVIDAAEAQMLADCGVTHLGFPLRLPVHEEDLSEQAAAEIIVGLSPAVSAVLITYLDKASEILEFCEALGATWVQLHGDITEHELVKLRASRRELVIIKSLVVRDSNIAALESDIQRYERCVDAFITDTFDPVTGASGATGKLHDVAIDRRLVECSRLPVIAAGGLNASNVCERICAVRPAGVDVHTGVEGEDGRKSRAAVTAFVAEAKRGFSLIGGSTDSAGRF